MELIQSFISIAETAAKQQARQLKAAANTNPQPQAEENIIYPEGDAETGPYCFINTFITYAPYPHQ